MLQRSPIASRLTSSPLLYDGYGKFEVVDTIPISAAGKILRRLLPRA